MAQAKTKDKDLEEGTPDHPGETLETAEVNGYSSDAKVARAAAPVSDVSGGNVVQAAVREPVSTIAAGSIEEAPAKTSDAAAPVKLPTSGTVVLDVEQGGIEVPSFVGKTVRGAVETAQDIGLELDAVGSGVARQQNPPAGTHVAAGARVTVQFGR
jgi:cell division protein FtsI (penicillin-binding protein 3)